jgi:hypothetical protein
MLHEVANDIEMSFLARNVESSSSLVSSSVHLGPGANKRLDYSCVALLACDIQRCIATTKHLLRVSSILEELLDHIIVAVLTCDVERSRSIAAHAIHRGACFAKQLHHCSVAVLATDVHRCVAIKEDSLGIRSISQQELHALNVPAARKNDFSILITAMDEMRTHF